MVHLVVGPASFRPHQQGRMFELQLPRQRWCARVQHQRARGVRAVNEVSEALRVVKTGQAGSPALFAGADDYSPPMVVASCCPGCGELGTGACNGPDMGDPQLGRLPDQPIHCSVFQQCLSEMNFRSRRRGLADEGIAGDCAGIGIGTGRRARARPVRSRQRSPAHRRCARAAPAQGGGIGGHPGSCKPDRAV